MYRPSDHISALSLRWRCRVSIDNENPRAHTPPETIKPYFTFETELLTSGCFELKWKKSVPSGKVHRASVTNSRAGFSRCHMRARLNCTSPSVADLWVPTNLPELPVLHESGAHLTLYLQSIHLLCYDKQHIIASASMMGRPSLAPSSPQLVCPYDFKVEEEGSTKCS